MRVITASAWSATRIVLLLLALTACTPTPDQTLRLGLASAPVTLDPRFATDATSSRINRLLYARLVEFDDRQAPVPGLARWEVVTPRHYRFRLIADHPGRRFHDGSRLTAQDVKATFDAVLEPRTGSPHRASLTLIERIEVEDDDSLSFYLSRADALFPAYLVIGILPMQAIREQRPVNRQPMGSGPFRFVSWPEAGQLYLERRSDGQRVGFITVKDATVRVLKLLRGEVNVLQNDLPPELVNYLQNRADISVTKVRGSNFTYLGFNLDDPLLGQLAVRRAIALAINREAIIRYVMGSAARPASALLPPEHWAGNDELALIPYDPAAARALLAGLGYGPSKPLRLTYKTSTNAFRVRLATVLQSQLKAVGIDVDLRSYDWGTFYGDIKAGNFQMFSLSWVGIKSPDIFRYVFHSDAVPPNGANRGRFRDPVSDRLIEAAGVAGSQQAQARGFRRLQARLLEQLPYVPLWYEDHVFAMRPGVEGYSVGKDGNFDGLVAAKLQR
ncbi:MAG: ABC transporter substrate-binding protein [Gammaproteobacteria bacterium]|nr:ABC transporter substrate-binding protein [Gammaproteobacteria bacterium]